MTSITYENIKITPYKVNKFIWDSKTNEAIMEVTITGFYINSSKDNIVEIKLENINSNPNYNYFMPSNCFSITENGHIYPNKNKLLSITDTTDLSILSYIASGYGYETSREPYQWEYDRQSQKEDLMHSYKSINTIVWNTIDNYIICHS